LGTVSPTTKAPKMVWISIKSVANPDAAGTRGCTTMSCRWPATTTQCPCMAPWVIVALAAFGTQPRRLAYRHRLRGRGTRRRSWDGQPSGARCTRPGRRSPSSWRVTDVSIRDMVAASRGAGAPWTTLETSQPALQRRE
jgi:hypothetical protein